MDAGDSPSHRTNRDWLRQMACQARSVRRNAAPSGDRLGNAPAVPPAPAP